MEFENEILKVLVQRIDHLETVLFSSALGFLITTTIALFSAIYLLRNETTKKIKPSFIITGSNLVYVLLSGYYYFILTHFYATVITIIPFKDKIPNTINIDTLWTSFQISLPFLEKDTKIFFALLNAPLFPLLFSSISILGVWAFVKGEISTPIKRTFAIGISILLQIVLFFLMIWHPFTEFIHTIL